MLKGNSNAKCKRKLQMQNANLKFLSKPRILPKPKIFAKQEFYSPLACKHFRWPQLGRIAKKFIGLTLKCQLKRYPCCHHSSSSSLCYLKMLAGNSKFESEKFRIFGGKFKCKMQNAKLKYTPKHKIFAQTLNFCPNLKFSPEPKIFART